MNRVGIVRFAALDRLSEEFRRIEAARFDRALGEGRR